MSRDTTVIAFRQPEAIDDPLTEVAREGARRMLAQVLIAEANSFVAIWKDLQLPDGRGVRFNRCSAGELPRAFGARLGNATRICDAKFGNYSRLFACLIPEALMRNLLEILWLTAHATTSR